MTGEMIFKKVADPNSSERREIEKMFGKSVYRFNSDEMKLGCIVLAAFYDIWNKTDND